MEWNGDRQVSGRAHGRGDLNPLTKGHRRSGLALVAPGQKDRERARAESSQLSGPGLADDLSVLESKDHCVPITVPPEVLVT